MVNDNHEPIYNQEDMDSILVELSKAKREIELSHQLLWAVVQSQGGHVQVHYSLWSGAPERGLEIWDDPENYEMNLRVPEIRERQDV